MSHREIIQQSKGKLDTRLRQFLRDAPASERSAVEASRSKVLQVMQEATTAHDERYPTSTPGSERGLIHRVKGGCRTVGETAYDYAQILDVMVGQAPEYVALVYGAVKILLMVHHNYQEMKQKIKEYLDIIKAKFEIVEHLTSYIVSKRLVDSLTKMHDFFNRFLAKALKFYTGSRVSGYTIPYGIRC